LPLTGLLPKAPVRQHPGAAQEWRPVPLPAGLLTAYGVRPALLLLAAVEARRQAITPEAALLASGSIGDSFYYRCLAHRLGAAFIDGDVVLGNGARYPHAIHAGLAPLDDDAGPGWLAAPISWQERAAASAWAPALRSRRLRICPAWCARRRSRRSCARQLSASPISIQAFPRKPAQARRNAPLP
jgi:hypothetical protein